MQMFEKMLTENPALLDFQNEEYRRETLLHACATFNTAQGIRCILSCRADVNLQNSNGCMPLHIASNLGNERATMALLDGHADVDQLSGLGDSTTTEKVSVRQHGAAIKCMFDRNVSGRTALHFACIKGHKRIVSLLLDRLTDVNLQASDGMSALHQSCLNCQKDIVKILLDRNASADIKEAFNGATPIMIACMKNDKAIVRMLLNAQANINLTDDRNGMTPLGIASANGDKHIVNMLLQNNAMVDYRSSFGCTPLYAACQNDHKDIAEILLDKHAEIDIQNNAGYTALYVACANGRECVVRLLLNRHANVNLNSYEGLLPIDISRIKGYFKITAMILSSQNY